MSSEQAYWWAEYLKKADLLVQAKLETKELLLPLQNQVSKMEERKTEQMHKINAKKYLVAKNDQRIWKE